MNGEGRRKGGKEVEDKRGRDRERMRTGVGAYKLFYSGVLAGMMDLKAKCQSLNNQCQDQISRYK